VYFLLARDGHVPNGVVPTERGFRPPGPGPEGMKTWDRPVAPVREVAVRIGGARGKLGPLLWLPFPPGEPRFREGGVARPSLAPF